METLLKTHFGCDIGSYIHELLIISLKNEKFTELTNLIIYEQMILYDNTVFIFNTDVNLNMINNVIKKLKVLKKNNCIDSKVRVLIFNWMSSIYFNIPKDKPWLIKHLDNINTYLEY